LDFNYINSEEEFEKIISFFIIESFGESLNIEILELFNELNFSDRLVDLVKKFHKRTPRKYLRKPMTPSKVIREEGKSCGSHPRSNSNLKLGKYVDTAVQTD
jgi:hypothetical protein